MRISDLLDRGTPTYSFEFFPPKSPEGWEALRSNLVGLRRLEPDFVSITYGAGGSTRNLTLQLVDEMHAMGLLPMAHLTCVGHTADELGAILDHLDATGTRNVLTLRGDPPKGETRFVTVEGGFAHASELAAFARSRHGFCLGGACYPEKHPESPSEDEDLARLAEKVNAGVEFLITQLFFDPDAYFRFVDRCRRAGIGVPIVPGIMPVTSLKSLDRFTTLIGATIPSELRARLDGAGPGDGEVARVGIEWAVEQCRALLAGGAPGIHFYTLNRSHATETILNAVR